jgi:hypothetical protein
MASQSSQAQSPNQFNYQDDQNYSIDIDKIYSDFIGSIDAVRSYTNCSMVTDQIAKTIFGSGDTTLSQLKQQVQIVSTYQESRCHAFFRIIGFPVVSSSFSIYNPGYDTVYPGTNGTARTIGAAVSSAKLSIAGSQIAGERDLSIQREALPLTYSSIFATQGSITASTLALSGVNTRLFASPLTKTLASGKAPFDVSISNQQYTRNFLMGSAYQYGQLLESYVDTLGNSPLIGTGLGQISTSGLHIISPFIVDPVIDFSVNDSSRLVAVPFVPTKANLKVKDDIFVSRPIIEQVIRDRITIFDQSNSSLGTNDKATIDYVKGLQNITDQSILDLISGSSQYSTGQQQEFTKFVNIIRAMMVSLRNAIIDIGTAQQNYYYVPVPALNGPEGGCTTQGVFLSQNVPLYLLSPNDIAIINATIKNTLNIINTGTLNITGAPDVGGFAFDSFKNTFGPETSSAFGDASSDNMQSLTKKRNGILQKGNDGLRTIEIIMGEFSGLGLCDIIAIMGALYIMPEAKLLGFLDADALVRMNTILGTNLSSNDIQDTMTSFSQNVLAFYNLMDSIFNDVIHNNQN